MAYCQHCGKELVTGSVFCSYCGTPIAPAPVVPAPSPADTLAEEQEFLDWTHRLLRWERKAWSIAGKVFFILGIVFAALFAILSIIFLALGEEFGFALGFVYFWYAIAFGGMFVALGIVNKKAADKIPFYLNNLYTDFRYAYDRCGNVGMLVFCALLGTVSPVFFIINFVRMKANRKLIERIIARQNQ